MTKQTYLQNTHSSLNWFFFLVQTISIYKMTSESRPICVYALAGLKRNSTKLLVVMCIGIGLALYGIYIGVRSQTNPNYQPTITVAANWLYQSVGQKTANSGYFMNGCRNKQSFKPTFGHLLMSNFVYPISRYSGILNGSINVAQIILLKVFCKSFSGTDAIIGLSAIGLIISMICLVGSFAFCKLICISCLGIHHIVIIYLAIRRRRMLKNILCPPQNINEGASSCSFGPLATSTNSKANSNSAPRKPPSTGGSTRRPSSNQAGQNMVHRRSGRNS